MLKEKGRALVLKTNIMLGIELETLKRVTLKSVSSQLVLNLGFAPPWVYMGHLLQIKYVHSRLNVNILASTNVPFRPTTVQMPNLALTWHETDNSAYGDLRSAGALFTRQIYSRDGGGRAGWSADLYHSITDHRIELKFNMKMDNGVLLLCYLDKICLTLTGDFWRALASLYS